MCGIFGYFHNEEPDEILVKNYFEKTRHRGPDFSTIEKYENDDITAYLGFHRLSIMDTTSASNRIMSLNGVHVICNGEIYNYKYLLKKYSLVPETGSDCEVILLMYLLRRNEGLDSWQNMCSELDGDFACIIYDETIQVALFFRDRIGVKPLFTGTTKNSVCVASEAKSILADNAEQLKPGVLMTLIFEKDTFYRVHITPWYNYCVKCPLASDYETCKILTRTLLIRSVEKRCMSDRPIGFLLSGGLDSSLIASIGAQCLKKQINTFSVGLPASPDLKCASIVSKFIGSNHHELLVTPTQIIEAIKAVIYHTETYDITTIRASVPMYLLSKYISEKTDVRVVLSGEGADELFGGYLYFHKAPNYEAFQTESDELIDNLYNMDVLRGDRATAACGLEIRVPFLDADFVEIVRRIDPYHKMPKFGLEKSLLRDSFSTGWLPHEILMRQKEAFSDGIGYSSVTSLKKHAEIQNVKTLAVQPPNDVQFPSTPEGRLYFSIFQSMFPHTGMYTKKYWMPKWTNVTDPSATLLDVHNKNIG